MFKFSKNQRLCNKKAIDKLFLNGKKVNTGHILFFYLETEKKRKEHLKALIVVPKKNIKSAPTRNKIRRRIKDVYRKNKSKLEAELIDNIKTLNIAIVFKGNSIIQSQDLEYNIRLGLEDINKNI